MKRALFGLVVSWGLGASMSCAPSSSLPAGSRCADQGPIRADIVLKNGNIYTKTESEGPIRSSSYGLENIVQLKITRRGDKIIAKELVEPEKDC